MVGWAWWYETPASSKVLGRKKRRLCSECPASTLREWEGQSWGRWRTPHMPGSFQHSLLLVFSLAALISSICYIYGLEAGVSWPLHGSLVFRWLWDICWPLAHLERDLGRKGPPCRTTGSKTSHCPTLTYSLLSSSVTVLLPGASQRTAQNVPQCPLPNPPSLGFSQAPTLPPRPQQLAPDNYQWSRTVLILHFHVRMNLDSEVDLIVRVLWGKD